MQTVSFSIPMPATRLTRVSADAPPHRAQQDYVVDIAGHPCGAAIGHFDPEQT
jgi:hypothetical protein